MSPSALNDTLNAVPIDVDSKDQLDQFISIIVHAFSTTPLTTAIIANHDSTPPPYPSPLIDYARRHKHFSQGIIDSASSGAEIVQAGDWSAVALWEAPTSRERLSSTPKPNRVHCWVNGGPKSRRPRRSTCPRQPIRIRSDPFTISHSWLAIPPSQRYLDR